MDHATLNTIFKFIWGMPDGAFAIEREGEVLHGAVL